MGYKIIKYKGKHKIKDTKSGKSIDIDIQKFMNGGYKDIKIYSPGGEFPCAPNDLECQKSEYRKFIDSGDIDMARNNPFFDERDFTLEGRKQKGLGPGNRPPFSTAPIVSNNSNDLEVIDEKSVSRQNTSTVTTDPTTGVNTIQQQARTNPSDNSLTRSESISEDYSVKNTNVVDKENIFNIYNPYAGVDIPTAAVTLGQSIENKNTLGTVGSALKLGTGLARNFLSGMGQQRRYNQVMRDYYQTQKDNKNTVQYLAYGGKKDEELATGEYMHGVFNEDTEDFNAEIEQGEYFQTNQGDIAEVVGDKHTQGGEKIMMEVGERVLSDQLKLGSKQAKALSKKYDIKLKAKNTYSDVLDKFRKKTGLDKLIEEEAQLLKKVGDQDKVTDPTTKSFNVEVLSKKIQEISDKKHPLEEARKDVFEELFNRQETYKSKDKKNNDVFKKGGEKDPPEEEKDPIFKFLLNDFLDDSDLDFDSVQTQTSQEGSSSNVTSFGFDSEEEQTRLQQLRKNFPVEFDKTFKKDEQGNYQIIPSKEGEIKGQILDFQKRVDNNYQKLIDEVAPTLDEKDRQAFIEKIKSRRFDDKGKIARRFDDKLGLFTSTRTNARLPFAKPEDLKKLEDLGITTRAELFNPDGSLKKEVENLNLDPGTIDTIDRVKEFQSNFLLGEYNPPSDIPGELTPPEPKEEKDPGLAGGLFLFPDESPLPPSPLQGTIKAERRFDRVRPTEINPEPYLQDIRDREASQVQSLEGLSPNVRAAVLANVRANSQKAESDLRNRLDTQNLQSQERAIYTNAQIQAKEENASEQDRLSYEQRQYRAQALTDNDINNYFNQLQSLNKQRFMDIHNLNLINASNEDVYFDGQNFRRKNSDRDILNRAKI